MTDWLRCLRSRVRPAMRMVCAAHAGGSASMFARWHEYLPQSVEVWAVQPPGREDRLLDPPVRSIDAIVEAVGPRVRALGMNTELVLFGNCLGALVMYELARWLRAHGAREPKLLVVSAHPAPPCMEPPPDPPVYSLPDEEVIRVVGGFAGIDPELLSDPEMVELMMPAMRADAQAHETYEHRPGELFDFDILAVAGRDDSDVPVGTLHSWARETRGSCSVRVFPGDHLFAHTQTAELMSFIRQSLAIG